MKPNKEFADALSKVVLKQYEQLSKKGKPQLGKEWTLLAAVVEEHTSGTFIMLENQYLKYAQYPYLIREAFFECLASPYNYKQKK